MSRAGVGIPDFESKNRIPYFQNKSEEMTEEMTSGIFRD